MWTAPRVNGKLKHASTLCSHAWPVLRHASRRQAHGSGRLACVGHRIGGYAVLWPTFLSGYTRVFQVTCPDPILRGCYAVTAGSMEWHPEPHWASARRFRSGIIASLLLPCSSSDEHGIVGVSQCPPGRRVARHGILCDKRWSHLLLQLQADMARHGYGRLSIQISR